MRRLTDFKVELVDDDGSTYIITGERDTLNLADATFDEVRIPLSVPWENGPEIYPIPLQSSPASNPPRERGMGSETLFYGQRDFSEPDGDGFENVQFDFREYPSGVFDLFEMQLSDNLWHLDNYL